MDTLNAEIAAFLAAPETQTLTAAMRLLRRCQSDYAALLRVVEPIAYAGRDVLGALPDDFIVLEFYAIAQAHRPICIPHFSEAKDKLRVRHLTALWAVYKQQKEDDCD